MACHVGTAFCSGKPPADSSQSSWSPRVLAAWARGRLQAPRPHGSPGASPSSGWGTRCPLPRRECEPRAPARQSAPRPPDKYQPFRQQRAAQPSQCLLVDRNLPMKRTRNTERASGPRAPSGPRPQLSLWPPAPSAALPPRPSRQQPRRFSGRRFGWSGFIINAERCAAWPFAPTALECGPAGRRAGTACAGALVAPARGCLRSRAAARGEQGLCWL